MEVTILKDKNDSEQISDTFHTGRKRDTCRQKQIVDFENNIRISLQNCQSLKDNRDLLNGYLCSCKTTKYEFRCLLGLISVLDYLSIAFVMTFDEAYNIFASYFEHWPDKVVFRDNLLDERRGLLCCYFEHPIQKVPFIAVRLPEMQTEALIKTFLTHTNRNDYEPEISPKVLERIIKSMDTEYDRQCIKSVLSATNTNTKMYEYGINPQAAKRKVENIINTIAECDNAIKAATDMVNLRLESNIKDLTKKASELESNMTKNEGRCDQKILESLQQERSDILKQIEEKQNIQNHEEKHFKNRFYQAVKRTADSLIDENRVKRRRLGAGPSLKMDDDDEEFLLNCIEAKATAHGRRQDTVMYLNHVVKKRTSKK